MYAALCTELENSSKLVHAICKGEEPKEGKSNTWGQLLHVLVGCEMYIIDLAVIDSMYNSHTRMEQNRWHVNDFLSKGK